jgi:diguanylate cyclase
MLRGISVIKMTIISEFFSIFFGLFNLTSVFSFFIVVGIISLCCMILNAMASAFQTKKYENFLHFIRSFVPLFSIFMLQSYLLSIDSYTQWLTECNLQVLLWFYFLLMLNERGQVYILTLVATIFFINFNFNRGIHDITPLSLAIAVIGLLVIAVSAFVIQKYSVAIIENKLLFVIAMIVFATSWGLLILPSQELDVLLFIALICKLIVYMTCIHLVNSVGRIQYEALIERINTDFLTQLSSRTAFEKSFDQSFKAAKNKTIQLAFIILDIDNFKLVNDTYGHLIGDAVLKEVSHAIRENIVNYKGAELFRIGGEEFGTILENTDYAEAQKMSLNILKAVNELSVNTDKGTFGVTISIGVAEWHEKDKTKEMFYNRAESYLYFAKNNGKNAVTVDGVIVNR